MGGCQAPSAERWGFISAWGRAEAELQRVLYTGDGWLRGEKTLGMDLCGPRGEGTTEELTAPPTADPHPVAGGPGTRVFAAAEQSGPWQR